MVADLEAGGLLDTKEERREDELATHERLATFQKLVGGRLALHGMLLITSQSDGI
jgi:hypothetical protein